MNPRNCNEQTINFLCLLIFFFKGNNKTAHWVGQLQLKYLDTDFFFLRKPVVEDIESNLTSNTIEQSTSVRKKNQDL